MLCREILVFLSGHDYQSRKLEKMLYMELALVKSPLGLWSLLKAALALDWAVGVVQDPLWFEEFSIYSLSDLLNNSVPLFFFFSLKKDSLCFGLS